MSWLFSQALEAEFSAATCSDGAPSQPSSGSPTPQAYLSPDRMTAFSRPSRFGMTFAPLTDGHSEALLMWFLAASRARTSALQAREPGSTVPAQGCGPTWRGSLAKFDPDSSTWRTAQPSLLGDSEECSVTWPRSGMTAGGLCWELPTLAPPTSATGSGLWPTPVATDHLWNNSEKLDNWQRRSTEKKAQGINLQFALRHAVQMWPTPTVCGNHNRKGASATSGDGLATAVMKWPTPDANMGTGGRTSKTPPTGKRASGTKQQITLNDAVKWATPLSRDWRSGKASQATHDKNSRPLSEQVGGSLNPTWVEWLMGWPLGWTDLKPLAMDKCQPAPQPLGACSLKPEPNPETV